MGVVEDGGQGFAGMVEAESLFDEPAFTLERGAFELDAEGVAEDFDGVGVRVPGQILIVLFPKLRLYRFWGVGGLFPELLSILEECGATGLGAPGALRISRIIQYFGEG